MSKCSSFWKGKQCVLPAGHNMGQVDIPENHLFGVITRPSWDEYFLGIAEAVSKRGDCTRSQVGAVLVERATNRILSTGYNGVLPGQLGCLSGACPRGNKSYSERPPGGDYSDCISRHAEWNATVWCRDKFDMWGRMLMYITRAPCQECQLFMSNHSINEAIYPGGRWISF